MRPVSVFANGPDSEIERLRAQLRGPWRQATRAVMVLLFAARATAGADRRAAGVPPGHGAPLDRPVQRGGAGRAGGPAPVRPAPARRPAADHADRRPAGPARAAGRCRGSAGYLGWPQVSPRTLYRRVRLVAVWRRPKLTARGDPDHDHVVAGITARLIELPRGAVVLAEDETHLNLLPHARASWTLRTARRSNQNHSIVTFWPCGPGSSGNLGQNAGPGR
jgi:hypothetical protein